MDISKLSEPFAVADLEWRVARAGEKNGQIWAMVLTYITARAIMDRLDEVCDPENWQTDYRDLGGALTCGIGIRVGEEWVWKWDGTGHLATNDGLDSSDAGKGDFSNALKRAGVQWGIGRYLYGLTEGWAKVHERGAFKGRTKEGKTFKWDPPDLPAWALPGHEPPEHIHAEVTRLLEEAAKGGHVGMSESARIEAALADENTTLADLMKTRRILSKWIGESRTAPEEAVA